MISIFSLQTNLVTTLDNTAGAVRLADYGKIIKLAALFVVNKQHKMYRSESKMTEMIILLWKIIIINLVLSGDNAVVIALASRNLPASQKKKAIYWGSALAVILRISLVVLVTYLMKIPYLQAVGGLALIYIGYQLLASGDDDVDIEGNDNMLKAIKTILVADLVMSIDNVLAIAAIAKGHWGILIFGLALSIPIVIFGATLLSKLMKRFPIIVYIGAALIAYTAAEMIITDIKTAHILEPYALIIKTIITVGVVASGYFGQHRIKSIDQH